MPEKTRAQLALDMYHNALNAGDPIHIVGYSFDRADVLRQMDPIAYREEFYSFCESMGENPYTLDGREDLRI